MLLSRELKFDIPNFHQKNLPKSPPPPPRIAFHNFDFTEFLQGTLTRLALDNIEWSQIGHPMNFTQRIISIMERDWNVEWG